MEFIVENWYILVGLLAIIAAVVIYIVRFFKKRTEKQLESIKEWLLWATTEAEKRFGSGTGRLKLRTVYDMFLAKFLWLAKVISFDMFSGLVDEALEDMNDLLTNNAAVHLYVNGPDEDDDDPAVEG